MTFGWPSASQHHMVVAYELIYILVCPNTDLIQIAFMFWNLWRVSALLVNLEVNS